jgi:peroxiredoxin
MLLLAVAPLRAGGGAPDRAMDFELRDQFGKTLAYRFPKERVSVLVFGDRKGSEQVEGWVRPVYERYTDRIDLHGVAVLTSVPSLFHGYARRQFRKKVKYPVLLDFKGDVTKGYGYEGDKANVLVIARDGAVAHRAAGAATPDGLNRLYAEVDRLLDPGR